MVTALAVILTPHYYAVISYYHLVYNSHSEVDIAQSGPISETTLFPTLAFIRDIPITFLYP